MALTIRKLNGDASFLLTLEPIELGLLGAATSPEPFRILLDPCLTAPPGRPDAKLSSSKRDAPYPATLENLPEPDVIIISSNRGDHCNESTLRYFAHRGAQSLVLAEPTAARTIKNWRYFEQGRVLSLLPWQDPRRTGQDNAIRMPIPARVIGGNEGMVTVAFITRKRDRKRLHSAIGITYRPASSGPAVSRRPTSTIISKPSAAAPSLASQTGSLARLGRLDSPTLPPLPAFKPLASPSIPDLRTIRTSRSMASLSPHARDRGVSVIFSPHGIPYTGVEPYATSHLLAEAALPLTALLHCFDTVSRPWWLGGDLTTGFDNGQEIIAKLGARAWVSTYDGDKGVTGLTARFTRHKKYSRDDVRQLVQGTADAGAAGHKSTAQNNNKMIERRTEVLSLSIGEDVTLTSEGIWATDQVPITDSTRLSIRHVSEHFCQWQGDAATFKKSQTRPISVTV
ncbi:uncharacterized protein UV8b_02490 [Ustilaginoidea virens]|uniref:Metallo-beta-lactamase domain-containing protein n=1 Tax=Ustilaginoidea virens TaxID=1159556 RepID=A0A063BS61_USTVR|nr:uncharacterized protein UV8b_02490 [Ustilaginoidea virens]QUC18249.1 hypothetical protein UV8b_02490 [Ustilaginoidea virens]GAO16098.1 hypothetical protein UVI_02039930 [Ustilaginoidea virens]